jgi:type IV pilus assembly protein PilA
MMSNKLKSRKGFTLIELIIVIAILGIILLIGVPRFTDVLRKAQINADRATASSIGKSVRLWNIDNLPSNRPVPTLFTEFVTANNAADAVLEDINNYFSIDTQKPDSYKAGAADGSYYIKADANGKIAVAIAGVPGGVEDAAACDDRVEAEVIANVNGPDDDTNTAFPASQAAVLYGAFNTDAGWAYLEQ